MQEITARRVLTSNAKFYLQTQMDFRLLPFLPVKQQLESHLCLQDKVQQCGSITFHFLDY